MAYPNIIFIFSDQQRYNTRGCTGNPIIRTPAFDRLAANGVPFGTVLKCNPARDRCRRLPRER